MDGWSVGPKGGKGLPVGRERAALLPPAEDSITKLILLSVIITVVFSEELNFKFYFSTHPHLRVWIPWSQVRTGPRADLGF